MKINSYLYEIIDDYQNAGTKEEQTAIFQNFCSLIWCCQNQRRTYRKTIRFTVRKDLLHTDIGQVFETWSEIPYMGCNAMSKETDWCSLIRQKINNLYTRYFDREVILKQDYLDLLSTPKRLYYQWIGGAKVSPDELTCIIDDAIYQAEQLKTAYQKQKMNLSWKEYKKLTEDFLEKIFHNCRSIEDYEDKTKIRHMYDFINEDNFYIRYFCKSLEAYLMNYHKEYYGLKRGRNKQYAYCRLCGGLMEKNHNRRIYCPSCSRLRRLESYRKYNKNRTTTVENS